jgi:hypothetical protein
LAPQYQSEIRERLWINGNAAEVERIAGAIAENLNAPEKSAG